MKKLLFLSAGLLLILFTSCKDDDTVNEVMTLESQLIDTWIITDIDINGSVSIDIYGEEMIFDIESEIGKSTSIMVLASDGTFEATGETNFSMDLLQDGEVVNTIQAKDFESVEFSGTGTWSVNENDEIAIAGDTFLFENDQLIFAMDELRMTPPINGFTFNFENASLIFSRE